MNEYIKVKNLMCDQKVIGLSHSDEVWYYDTFSVIFGELIQYLTFCVQKFSNEHLPTSRDPSRSNAAEMISLLPLIIYDGFCLILSQTELTVELYIISHKQKFLLSQFIVTNVKNSNSIFPKLKYNHKISKMIFSTGLLQFDFT